MKKSDTNLPVTPLQPQHLALLDEIKNRIRQSRLQVAHAANRELIQLYWWLGKNDH